MKPYLAKLGWTMESLRTAMSYGHVLFSDEVIDELEEWERKMKARAHRIEVDHCNDCVFRRVGESSWCRHPAAKRCGALTYKPDPPPEWCPLRGAVTMIAGPRE